MKNLSTNSTPLCYLKFQKYPYPQGDFFGKMIVTFAYLLCPIIPSNISKRPLERIMIFKVAKLLANVVPNYPFAAKQNFFGGNFTATAIWLLLCCIILGHFKKTFCELIIRQGCIILAQIGPKLRFPPTPLWPFISHHAT